MRQLFVCLICLILLSVPAAGFTCVLPQLLSGPLLALNIAWSAFLAVNIYFNYAAAILRHPGAQQLKRPSRRLCMLVQCLRLHKTTVFLHKEALLHSLHARPSGRAPYHCIHHSIDAAGPVELKTGKDAAVAAGCFDNCVLCVPCQAPKPVLAHHCRCDLPVATLGHIHRVAPSLATCLMNCRLHCLYLTARA